MTASLDRRDVIAEALKAADYNIMFDGTVSAIDISPLVDAVESALASREDGWYSRHIGLADRLFDLLIELKDEGYDDLCTRIFDAMADPTATPTKE